MLPENSFLTVLNAIREVIPNSINTGRKENLTKKINSSTLKGMFPEFLESVWDEYFQNVSIKEQFLNQT